MRNEVGVMKVVRTVALAVMVACFASQMQGEKLSYPGPEIDVVDDYHGTKVADPYRWMEDLDAKEVADWVAAQNAVTSGYLERAAAARALPQAHHRALELSENAASRFARPDGYSTRRTAGCSGRRRSTCARILRRRRRW